MHQLGELRRNRRTKLNKDHKKSGMTHKQVLASQPPTVITTQWMEMVGYWFNDKTEVLLLSHRSHLSGNLVKRFFILFFFTVMWF